MSSPSIVDPAELGAGATAAEIAQQPAVWRLVGACVPRYADPLLDRPDLRIMLSGAGTSAYAGQILAPVLSRALHRRVDAVATTDIVAGPELVLAEDVPTLFVSFARSGDSPESLAAARLVEKTLSWSRQLVVTCNPDGALARAQASSTVLLMPEGTNDRGFAMTSSFTSMLLAARLALAPAPDGLAGRLADTGERLLATVGDRAAGLAARGYDRVVHLGSGALTGLAREGSLKLTELTAGTVVSWAESALGFRHGPKAVLRPGTLAVVWVSNDPYTRLYDLDIIAELRADLGTDNVLVVGSGEADVTMPELADVDDASLAVVMTIVAQQIALGFSLALGVRPDNPFPGGEVNRVVRGVTVHPFPA